MVKLYLQKFPNGIGEVVECYTPRRPEESVPCTHAGQLTVSRSSSAAGSDPTAGRKADTALLKWPDHYRLPTSDTTSLSHGSHTVVVQTAILQHDPWWVRTAQFRLCLLGTQRFEQGPRPSVFIFSLLSLVMLTFETVAQTG